MAKVTLSAEGQTIELPDDVAADDERLKQAIVPYYPQLATGKITRTKVDDVLQVTIAKQAGPKGARSTVGESFVSVLDAAPEHLNPAVELWQELEAAGTEAGTLSLSEAILLGEIVSSAAEIGAHEVNYVRGVFAALDGAASVPASRVTEGF